MIEEAYVSFETARLLKEKGFDEPTYGNYYINGSFEESCKVNWNKHFKTPISAPTQQMAMQWLRKKYRLFIAVTPFSKIDGCFYYAYTIIHLHSSRCDTAYKSDGFNSPEEAIEDALQYCLNNLI